MLECPDPAFLRSLRDRGIDRVSRRVVPFPIHGEEYVPLSFDDLHLDPRLLQAVQAMGYKVPTPIQVQAIPPALQGRDVVGCAQTGTGKTAAFLLPILQRISGSGGTPEALILTPTRELAIQIDEAARESSRFLGRRVGVAYGGVGYGQQLAALRSGIDLLVATPGRLLDLHQKRVLDLRRVGILVLDEADRMLDMGFLPQVRKILALIPARRQNMLFSATMSREVLSVIGSTLHDPVSVEVSPPSVPVSEVVQRAYPVGGRQKLDLLVGLIEGQALDRVLVFTRTKHRADRVARDLQRRGIASAAIHGNRSQGQRQRALDGFKDGRHDVLVATDIMARGIDIERIGNVINFDMPGTPEDYVHRIGRTARAGRGGTAISLLAPEEHGLLRDIERRIGMAIERCDLDGFSYSDPRTATPTFRKAPRGPAPAARRFPRRSFRQRAGRRR
jgi:ATP-dependent RNA helicase RhlE